MNDDPIDLDGRRTGEGKLESELRRRAANTGSLPVAAPIAASDEVDAALLVKPARTWVEAMQKTSFLLVRYAATSEARDLRIQELITRALKDLDRLKRRKEKINEGNNPP